MSTQYLTVKAGACIVGGELQRCALEASACDSPGDFISSHLLTTTTSTHVGSGCLGDTNNIPIGRCKSTGACVSTASSCTMENDFEEANGSENECTIKNQGATVDDAVPSLYGGCQETFLSGKKGVMCLWDKAIDCVNSNNHSGREELWMEPQTLAAFANAECMCEYVKTGACRSRRANYYCAVSEAACDSDTTFVSARHLPSTIDCRLCPPDNPVVTIPSPTPLRYATPLPTTPNPTVTDPPALYSQPPTTISTTTTSNSDNNNNNNNNRNLPSAIVGLLLGWGVGVLVMTLLLAVRYWRTKAQSAAGTGQTEEKDGIKKTLGEEEKEAFKFQGSSSKMFS